MIRLTILAVSSVLALSAAPVHAENPGDVLQGIGRAMNGGSNVDRDPDRDRERERAYRHEQHRLDAQQRDLDAQRRGLHDQRRFDEGNGYSGNGYSGNGYSGNGYSGNGYSGNGYSGPSR